MKQHQTGKKTGQKQPNILFIIADDHRFDGIGAYGNPIVQTPVLDDLAARGVLCKSIYTMGGQNAAICVPSRASLLTGNDIFRATVSGKEIPLSETENKKLWSLNPALVSLPEALRKEGYHTFATGKWHNGKESFAKGFADGGDIFFGGMGDHVGLPVHAYDSAGVFPDVSERPSRFFSTELFADAAIHFIQTYEKENPFFLYVAFTAPHDPRTPPSHYADLYQADHIPLPDNFLPEHPFDNGEMTVRDELLTSLPRSPAEIRQHLADYYSLITHMDEQIGRIVQALQANGYAEETMIVYTADHGIALGQHGLVGKQNLYEHSTHIPLILQGAGLPQGTIVEGLGCQMDIYPTLCELAAVPLPDTVAGKSLVPLLSGKQETVRESVFAAYKSVQRSVSDGTWKLIRYYRLEESGSDRLQLFHLKNDPYEMIDLHNDPGNEEQVQRLLKMMENWQQHTKDPLLERRAVHEPS